MPNETIVLDPSEVATGGRSELNINSGSIQVRAEGIDWGTSEIQAYMASQRRGESVVDFRIPNRQIQIPLVMQTVGTATFTSARDRLSTKVAQIQAQGGWIKRVTSGGGTYFADIVNASLQLPGGWLQAHKDIENEAVLTLEALPDFYGAEATLSNHTEASACEITFTETTTAGGDFPLGDRVRVVVDEDQGASQRGLFWHWRGAKYSAASTAASAYEAEALTTMDTTTRVAAGGASGGTMVTHGTLAEYWLPVVSTNLTAGSYLTHTGTNRIYARVFSTAGTSVEARFVWDVGDLVYPTENNATRLYNAGTFQILDLGDVHLNPSPTGTHRWQGQIQARHDTTGTVSFSVDRVWVVNRDESAGVLRAPVMGVNTTAAPVVRDDFSQTAGNLDAKTAQVGGAWGETTETGVSGFVVSGSGVATRGTVADVNEALGCKAFVGSDATTCSVRVDVKFDNRDQVGYYGVMARYSSATNFLAYVVVPDPTGTSSANGVIRLMKVVGGTPTTIATTSNSPFFSVENTYYPIQLTVDAAGNFTGYWQNVVVFSGNDSVLVTGETLGTGKMGLYDARPDVSACGRTYDNFAGWAPDLDAVMFASQSLELNTAGITREDSTGAAYGPVSHVSGDLPRMPNRSSAGTVEFMAKASRGDLETLPDPNIDNISAQVFRRPSYLTPD